MNRRSFLRFLGVAPVAAPAVVEAAAAMPVFALAYGPGASRSRMVID